MLVWRLCFVFSFFSILFIFEKIFFFTFFRSIFIFYELFFSFFSDQFFNFQKNCFLTRTRVQKIYFLGPKKKKPGPRRDTLPVKNIDEMREEEEMEMKKKKWR